jgi:hypothetical protein
MDSANPRFTISISAGLSWSVRKFCADAAPSSWSPTSGGTGFAGAGAAGVAGAEPAGGDAAFATANVSDARRRKTALKNVRISLALGS